MKQLYVILALVTFLLVTNCEDIVDCIINVRPELSEERLQVGFEGEYYFDKVRAGIKNEPLDNDYDYYMSVDGDIPAGIELFFEYREVIFEGVPIETGRFTFTVHLDVEYVGNEINDPLCDSYTSRTYTIAITQP